jgi:hypothetical protein
MTEDWKGKMKKTVASATLAGLLLQEGCKPNEPTAAPNTRGPQDTTQAAHWQELKTKPVFDFELEYVTYTSPTQRKTIDTTDSLNFLRLGDQEFGLYSAIHGNQFYEKNNPEQAQKYQALQKAYAALKEVIDRGKSKDLRAYLKKHEKELHPVVVEKAFAYIVSGGTSVRNPAGNPAREDNLMAFLDTMPWLCGLEFRTKTGVKKPLSELIHDGYLVTIGKEPAQGFDGDPALSQKIAAHINRLKSATVAQSTPPRH